MKLRLFALAAFLTIALSTASESHWGYPDLEAGEAFSLWGGICDTGKHQSPININIKGSLKGVYGKLQFNNYDEHQSDVVMVNTGHSVQLSNFTYTMELAGGPLLSEYVLEQLHLHWWSEHTIDNIRYPLEVHIVHRNSRYPNMTEAQNHKDGITVVAVLYHVSNQQNGAIEAIIQHLDEVKSYTQLNKPVNIQKNFVVQDLFPKIKGYSTYAGSLTTPSCAEAVTWIVLHETFPVTLEQTEKFKQIEIDENKFLSNNYRNLQNQNNRPIVVVLPEYANDCSNEATSLQISVLFVVVFAKLLL